MAAAELKQRSTYAVLCVVLHLLVLLACAMIGALRVPDLLVTLVTLAVTYALAIRDSDRLAPFLVILWVLARFVRRLIDWQLGGFESLTALSLLPMMATLTLMVPTLPRWKRIPQKVQQSLLLMGLPIAVATTIGLAEFGKAAVLDSAGWLVPMLFVPYFASRPTTAAVRRKMLRQIVWLAAVVAVYGWYQFIVLPPWDAMWLSQSGMTSSMGLAQAGQVRVWGTLSSAGAAAAFWAAAVGLLMCGVRPKLAQGALHAVLVGSVLLLARVRICWVSPLVGLAVYSSMQGRRGATTAIAGAFFAVALVLAAALLPGGELIHERLGTFSNLRNDHSFQTRRTILSEVTQLVAENPFGKGIGFKSALKVSGGSSMITSFDNGFGEVLYSLGLPGGILWLVGIGLLAKLLLKACKQPGRPQRELAVAALVQLSMSVASLASSFFLGGELGIVSWLAVGMALAPEPSPASESGSP